MSRYLVDTDWIIEVLRGSDEAANVLEELSFEGLAISAITYGELYEGVYYARDPSAALASVRDVLRTVERLPVTDAVMERFAIERGRLTPNARRQIGDFDLVIAATALAGSMTLLTFNLRHFRLVDGLRIYNS